MGNDARGGAFFLNHRTKIKNLRNNGKLKSRNLKRGKKMHVTGMRGQRGGGAHQGGAKDRKSLDSYYPFLATRATSGKRREKPRCRTTLPKKKKNPSRPNGDPSLGPLYHTVERFPIAHSGVDTKRWPIYQIDSRTRPIGHGGSNLTKLPA
jgi:hypothetical protein